MNDLPPLRECNIVVFADDVKVWRRIECSEDCSRLQEDLNTLYNWALANKLPYNVDKCRMMQIGWLFEHTYRLGPRTLSWTQAEKDLGVLICGSLKSSEHCEVVSAMER